MKKIISFCLGLFPVLGLAQQDILTLLNMGIEDAQHMSSQYITPAAEAAMYSMTTGWYNTAKTKTFPAFSISVVRNEAIVPDKRTTFTLNTSSYNNVRFKDGATQKRVATALGENNPDIAVLVDYETDEGTQSNEILLPQGVGEGEVNWVPSTFVQASLGLFEGFEVKARYSPFLNYKRVKMKVYGGAFQYEFSNLLFDKTVPVAISFLTAYTRLEGRYDIQENDENQGNKQEIVTSTYTWDFSLICSTKKEKLNFYGGIDYIVGEADTELKGSFFFGGATNNIEIDPFGVTNKINGLAATLGSSYTLGFFKLNASYSFQKYGTISVGLNAEL